MNGPVPGGRVRFGAMTPANSTFSALGTTIFEVMSRLAEQHGAVNLGQGFPDEGYPEDVLAKAASETLTGWNQYPSMMGVPELRQAVAAGTRYAAYQLTQYATGGLVPRPESIRAEALRVGDAEFWFIGRDNDQTPTSEPYFGLVDECSKLNLNTATRTMLEGLPGITPDVVDAIISWRSRNGGDDGSYARLEPARTNKDRKSTRLNSSH